MFAINVCAPTSGGHFHPAMTIAQVIFRGFPLQKAPLYILAQTFGAFLASVMVYASWRSSFVAYTAKLVASGHREAIFTPSGPAGILAIFPSPGRDLGEIFANEFFADFLIALVIWSQLDAQNVFASAAIAPYTIGLAFAVAIWGMGYQTVVANSGKCILVGDRKHLADRLLLLQPAMSALASLVRPFGDRTVSLQSTVRWPP